jgi:hypothetical protein
MSIATGIYALLQSKQPLTELVGANLMPLVKAQQMKTPCIIYAVDAVATNQSFAGGSLADTYNVSFHVFDREYDKAVQIARVLRNTIGFACGKHGGWDFRMVRFVNIQDSFQDAGQLYGQTLMFTMRVKNDPNFGLPKILRATFTEVGNLVGAGVNVYPLQLLVNEQGYLAATALVVEQLQVLFAEQGALTGTAAVQELFKLATTFTEAGTLTGRAVGAGFELAFLEQGNLQAQAQLAIQLALVATEQSSLVATAQSAILLAAQFAEVGQLNAQAFSVVRPVLQVVESGVFVGEGEVDESGLLLDLYPALAAISIRQLKSNITEIQRIRDSGDNSEANYTEQQIAAGLTAIGSDSGFITTAFNQGTAPFDFVQPTVANQMRILNAGVLETLNGKPALNNTVGFGVKNTGNVAFSAHNELWFFFVVGQPQGTNNILLETSANFNNVSGAILFNFSNETQINVSMAIGSATYSQKNYTVSPVNHGFF